MLPYLLTFCRATIGLTFAYSFLMKVRDVNQFAQTITHFKLLSAHRSQPLALLFLTGELAVVLLLFIGGQLLPLAFGLALLLLATFTAALAFVLAHHIQTACNCFGSHQNPATFADVGRNVGLILIALFGIVASKSAGQTGVQLTAVDSLLMAIAAAIFLFIWLNLRDIFQLFKVA
jgi:uncharacterized membrane protein YphA (DoxX/SURF4 family)